jgi:hypothetical protein
MTQHYDKDETVIRCKKHMPEYQLTTRDVMKIASLLLFIIVGSYNCHAAQLKCLHCENRVDIKIECGVFGDTWLCQNPHCGYENYTAVSRCGICGQSRY